MSYRYSQAWNRDNADFLADFHRSTEYGATENGGIDRQAGTKEHGQVRDWFVNTATRAGMVVEVDRIGNIYATYQWCGPEAESVLIGSHLDSQPLGGRFDGAFGVIAALHAAKAVNEKFEGRSLSPRFNLTVVDWFNEEGARFTPSIMGSSARAGLMDTDQLLATTDSQGTTVAEALEATGYAGTDQGPQIASYAEIHIEQGPRLERAGVPIGVVTGSWYTQKLLVKVIGEQSHTGATFMSFRRDALVAAAHVVIAVEQAVKNFEDEKIVTSVGQLDVLPNSPIVVAREVNLTVDLRAERKEDVEAARAMLLDTFAEIAAERNVEIKAQDFDIRTHQYFPEAGFKLVEDAAKRLGMDTLQLETMAGHDSIAMNQIAPSIMMFVPSAGGVSHCEREFTDDAALADGLRILTEVATTMVCEEWASAERDSEDRGSEERDSERRES